MNDLLPVPKPTSPRRVPALAAAIGCALLAGACGTLPGTAESPALRITYSIQSGKDAEDCFRLAAGEQIEYQFEATAPVDFNLHYHRGNDVFMPVQVARTREQSGVFASPVAEDYCMMWTNPGAVPAHLSGRWRRLR